MNSFRFIKSNLLYYWKRNLFLALGIGLGAAIITGSIIVGDSVRFSLNKIVENRLGKINYTIKCSDRYFTSGLSEKISADLGIPASSALQTSGIGSVEGGKFRIANIKLFGVDSYFDLMAGTQNLFNSLSGEEIILSENLAERLSLKPGEEILMRLSKASLIPLNAPFVSDKDNVISARFKVKAIAVKNELGSFNLENTQEEPLNAFVNINELCRLMDFDNKANFIFLSGDQNTTPEKIQVSISDNWNIQDAGFKTKVLPELNEIDLSCERVFIDTVVSESLLKAKGLKYPVFTYFVNSLSSSGKSTPYSFVSTLPDSVLSENEIVINSWLAEDLSVKSGDSLELEYYIIGPLRELTTEKESFVVNSVKKMEGYYADQKLMPEIPGLYDAGNCRDWETGVPVKLNEIRDKDEQYWKKSKGTPKAFVSLSTAQKLWKNQFGSYTAFRYSSEQTSERSLTSDLMASIHPADIGFQVISVREQGTTAASTGVDFAQLFGGLSFFLLLGGILLSVLLFLLNLESRRDQILLISALGIPIKNIRRLIITEGMIVAVSGSLIGILMSILYTRMIFSALNTIWWDIVRTNVMFINIKIPTLISGFLISLLIAWLSMFFPLSGFLKRSLNLRKDKQIPRKIKNNRNLPFYIFPVSGLLGIAIIAIQFIRHEQFNESNFFIAGGLILISGISGFYSLLRKQVSSSQQELSISGLSLINIRRNPVRSLSIVILFALASFLVISTGSNRKSPVGKAQSKSGGTGGFLFYAESTVPVLRNLNDSEVRYDFGLEGDYKFFQAKVSKGDDASCLNLNRIKNPGILGIQPSEFSGRFSFVSKTEYLDKNDPWSSLDKELPGNLIPAIADETVIKWGMGMKVGDTLVYTGSKGNNFKLLLIGGLAPSVFQGKVIVSNKFFQREFPENSGTEVFFIDGKIADTAEIVSQTKDGFRDYGWNMTPAVQRLAEFNSVTNTYLSIFMVLGAFGLLLGTLGLAVLMFRTIIERREEIAILRSVGISKGRVIRLFVNEYFILLFVGILAGILSAVISTLPSISNSASDVSVVGIILIFLALLVNGWLWTELLARIAMKDKSLYESLRNE